MQSIQIKQSKNKTHFADPFTATTRRRLMGLVIRYLGHMLFCDPFIVTTLRRLVRLVLIPYRY